MTNYPFTDISELRDVQTINRFNEMKEQGKIDNFDEVKSEIRVWSRDNARTPMQWTSGENAGFTDGEPWINVNPNKREINVEAERKDEDSVLQFYRKLISLRKEHKVLIYGNYKPILEEDEEIFGFLREENKEATLTMLNFSSENKKLSFPSWISVSGADLLLSNYPLEGTEFSEQTVFRPYEARIYKLKD